MRTPEQAIRNFVYFSLNYDYKFIEKCWEYDQSLVKHLREKFHMYYGKHGALGVMTEFFCNLSSGHQIRLAKWIDENYNEIDENEGKPRFRVINPKLANADQINDQNELSLDGKGFAYLRNEANKKAFNFQGTIDQINPEDLHKYIH